MEEYKPLGSINYTARHARDMGINLSPVTLRQWVKDGTLPHLSSGNKVLLYWPKVLKFITCGMDEEDIEPTDEPSSVVSEQPDQEKPELPAEPIDVVHSVEEKTKLPVEPIVVLQSKTTVQKSNITQETITDRKLYCRKCGHQLPSDSSFCMFCGEKVVFKADVKE